MSMIALLLAAQSATATNPGIPPPARATPAAIVAAAPPAAWRAVPADRLLLIELVDGARIAIELAPHFAPVHVENVRRLARTGWYDGAAVYRVQDNYVAQWGDGTERKPLPAGIVAMPPAEYERSAAGLPFRPLGHADSYAVATGHADGWPVATGSGRAWLPHCYGTVGVARNLNPDTGTGAELYAVIGHAPRQLDRNIAVVGRVLDGIEALAARPRGTGALGFYATPAQWIAVRRVAIAADLPAAARPGYRVMRSDSASFAEWLRARANREDDFYLRPAGGLDICNALPPVRADPAPR